MPRKRKKLNIRCTDTDCGNGLHCFKPTDGMVAQNKKGRCRECGVDLINWERVHSRELRDAEHTLQMFKFELVRHHFWHRPLGLRAINHAKRKGKRGIQERVRKHLATAIGPAHPWHDGTQTPMANDPPNAISYGQHATATCCRKCIEYWHGIPQGQELSAVELDYLGRLVCLYIEDRIPDLTQDGESVPAIRKSSNSDPE